MLSHLDGPWCRAWPWSLCFPVPASKGHPEAPHGSRQAAGPENRGIPGVAAAPACLTFSNDANEGAQRPRIMSHTTNLPCCAGIACMRRYWRGPSSPTVCHPPSRPCTQSPHTPAPSWSRGPSCTTSPQAPGGAPASISSSPARPRCWCDGEASARTSLAHASTEVVRTPSPALLQCWFKDVRGGTARTRIRREEQVGRICLHSFPAPGCRRWCIFCGAWKERKKER